MLQIIIFKDYINTNYKDDFLYTAIDQANDWLKLYSDSIKIINTKVIINEKTDKTIISFLFKIEGILMQTRPEIWCTSKHIIDVKFEEFKMKLK